MEKELQPLTKLSERLIGCRNDRERVKILDEDLQIQQQVKNMPWICPFFSDTANELILKSLIAIGQTDLLLPMQEGSHKEQIRTLLQDLIPVEVFYKKIGGIIGYHQTMLFFLSQLLDNHSVKCMPNAIENLDLRPNQSPGIGRSNLASISNSGDDSIVPIAGASSSVLNQIFSHVGYTNEIPSISYHRPPGIDLSEQCGIVDTFILQGIHSLPFLAEIYPVGGAADRLKLCDPETGQSLPSAKLQFCGFTLLERLIRDVQAREYLYFKLFGEQVTTPIAMMTSLEKDNSHHILQLCEQRGWFGRPKESFRMFCQPAVPAMDKKGKWCTTGQMKLLMKPGGHGVMWKLAKDEGIFDWFEGLNRKKILVRQINNPIAGIDYGLLSFCGVGFHDDEIFGFASCPRQVGSAEGVNVLIEKKGLKHNRYCLTSIEYCDFPKFSIEDVPVEKGSHYSRFPSNTNILFADIATVKETVEQCPIPGMLVNLKKISFADEEGCMHEQEVARLESTMQNLADCFAEEMDAFPQAHMLKTYLTYNHRQKTISAIKKPLQDGASLLETPEGCLYDFLCNAYELLFNHCGIRVPQVPSIESYIQKGPSFLFNYLPALGPLFSIIGQKLRRGVLHLHSELKLEIAEVSIENLTLKGSLHIIAKQPIGIQEGILRYSERVGTVILNNVRVENRGYDPDADNTYWKDEIARHELCEILIHGDGEFVAQDVTLRGAMRIEVDPGCRVTAFEENGSLKLKREMLGEAGKRWVYHFTDEGAILLT